MRLGRLGGLDGLARRLLLPALSGVLFSFAFPSVDAGYLAWVALVPLLLALQRRSPREAFLLGYLAGFVAFVLILSWMRLFGVVPWLLLAAYLAVYVGAFAGLFRWLVGNRTPMWGVLVAPLLWTGLEYLRSIGPLGFPWALLGLSQHAAIPVLQLVRVTGAYGISALIVFVNALLAAELARTPTRILEIVAGPGRDRRLIRFLVVAVAVAMAAGAAIVLVGRWGILSVPPVETGSVRVTTLQPNVPPPLKFHPATAGNNMQLLQSLVSQAASTPTDLIVMPETALPADIFGSRGLLPVVGAWAQSARSTLIATSLEHGTSNIAVAVAPSGTAVDRYDKVRLVAFAESGITPGVRLGPIWSPLGRLGVAICFESIFPEVSRALVRGGAQAIVVITNDAWSDGTAGPAQHARFAPLRAVETGRWVVQAANSGLSVIVDPHGRVVASLPMEQRGVLRGAITLQGGMTPYARWGDWFAQLMVAAAVAAVALRRHDLLAEIRRPAFRTAATIAILPLVASLALFAARAPWWAWTAGLLTFVAIFSAGQVAPVAGYPLRGRRGFPAALLVGSLLVAVLWGIVVLAFRANQIPVPVAFPTDPALVLRQVLIAAALELWLRGQAFGALAEWKGVPVAVGITTLMGMMVQSGLPAEAIAWAMVTGLAFGIIRARTGSALGLIVPHALGNLLIAFLTVVR
ncbi:MAG: apolipoprotein N-acyltransferase [bacterium]